jgi:CRP-like cAMP-binding protein
MTDRINRRVEIDDLLGKHPLFMRLRPERRSELVEKGIQLNLDQGEMLYRAGEKAQHAFVLLSGAIQIEIPSSQGTPGMVVAMVPAPGFLGEVQVLHRQPWSATGVTLFRTVALGIDAELLEKSVGSPDLSLVFYRELTWRFFQIITARNYHQITKAPEALARYLLSYVAVRRAVNVGVDDDVELNQAELGRATGQSRESVNRTLRDWERRSLISPLGARSFHIDESALFGLLPEGDRTLLVQPIEPSALTSISS